MEQPEVVGSALLKFMDKVQSGAAVPAKSTLKDEETDDLYSLDRSVNP